MTIETIVIWAIVGLIVGAIAKLLMPGNDPGGFIVTILLGIAGAFVGGWVGRQFGIGSTEAVTSFDLGSLGLSILGAIILLALYRLVAGRSRRY
jgi:uncharacterized membrane protein YeaQ/YmgE (transglycosylase-associated protein family)